MAEDPLSEEQAEEALRAIIQRAMDEFAGPGAGFVMVYGSPILGTRNVTNLDEKACLFICKQMVAQLEVNIAPTVPTKLV